jgi:hypothetical protein
MRWTVLAGLTGLALVLGYVGFERLPDGGDWSVWDSFHRSLQLFVLESGGVPPPIPWQLEVARFLAPAVTVAAAALALLSLFREQARLLKVRLRSRDHAVVAGLGSTGYALARQLQAGGVVVIEQDPGAPAIGGCRERGIPVVVGDAADPAVLARAALGRARRLFVVCGEDGVNADVTSAARGLGGDLAVYVHLDDLDLWRHLVGHELAAGARSSVRVEFFNLADAAARMLLEENPPFAPGAAEAHVVVSGVDGPGESVVLHAARAWLGGRPDADARMRVTVCGPDAEADAARLLARHPRLAGVCDIGTWTLHSAEGATPPAGLSAVTAAYACDSADARAVSIALALHASGALGPVPAVVMVRDESTGIATALHEGGGVVAFGLLARAAVAEVAMQGTTEVLARAKHEQYVRDERRRGRTPEENPSMAAWHELGESLRQSNRRFAEGVGEKLRSARIAIVPAPLADPGAPGAALPEEQVEELAVVEHDRWCADLIADGWRHGPGRKDPERKLHPSLVPWEELSEEEREKDREPVRALPELLAHLGFELRSAGTPAGEGPGAAPYAQPALP